MLILYPSVALTLLYLIAAAAAGRQDKPASQRKTAAQH